MNNLTLMLIRLAFLAVLWLFVIAAVGVVRTDLFGHGAGGPPAAAPAEAAAGEGAAARRGRDGPRGARHAAATAGNGGRAGRDLNRADGPANHHWPGK